MTKLKIFGFSAAVLAALSFSACGSDGGGSSDDDGISAAISGTFKDSNVIGIDYKSGSISGTTGANGSYRCEVGKDVTFSIGEFELGKVECSSLVTPVDLVAGGDADDQTVVNYVKFLTMLDSDSDPANGITITQKEKELSKDWKQVDFTSASFDTDDNLNDIVDDINANGGDSVTHTLLSDDDAKAHLKSTLMCAYSGAFSGSFTGDDKGGFGALILPEDGKMATIIYSNTTKDYYLGTGSRGFTLDTLKEISGKAGDVTFSGSLTANTIKGTWENTEDDKGSFSGKRIGGLSTAKYRLVGNYTGDAKGVFSIDIDSNNNISGISYSPKEDEVSKISGTLGDDGSIDATLPDGTRITGDYDVDTGTISNGHWENGDESGDFNAQGCQLN